MVPRSYRWAELDCDLLSRKALKALNAGTLGGHATRHTDEGEVQPLRLQPPLPLHSPPGGERRADFKLTILLKSTISGSW